ncbi:hypothetical protein QQ045_005741 [Rhodiola kirilowii]
MSCFKISILLYTKLAGDVLRFWWHSEKDKGIHSVKAEELYKGRWNGGLGFRRFELMSCALLAKQGWRQLAKPDLLVSKVFKARYYQNSDVMNATST